MNTLGILAILFVILIALISQWWLRLFFAIPCAFAILAAVEEAKSWAKLPSMFLMLLVPSVCCADIVLVRKQDCNDNACTIASYASASIIGKNRSGEAVLLSAGHFANTGETVHILWNRAWMPSTVIASQNDDQMDLCVFSARLSGSWKCEPVSDDIPDAAVVDVCGYAGPDTRTYAARRGVWRGHFIERVTVRQGDSGGPIMYRGRVVGVVRGHYTDGNRETVFTPGAVIIPWLVRVGGYVPQCDCEPTPKPAVRPSPIAVAPKPVPPPPTDEVDLSPVLAKLDAIEKRIQCLEKMPIPQGERGPPGLLGQVGPPGANGTPVDYRQLDQLRGELADLRKELDDLKLARITVQMRQNGKVLDEDTYPIRGYDIDETTGFKVPRPIKLDFDDELTDAVSVTKE